MDLTQIHYFLALARTLNFTRAAEACNVSQPALTKSIQRLEDELGGPLLLRERALTQLTPLGREMHPLLQHIHDAAHRAKLHALTMRSRDAAPLRLGFTPDAPLQPFVPLFAEMARALPGFELRLDEKDGARLMEALLTGSLDAAIVTASAALPERMSRWPLFDDAVVLLSPSCGNTESGPVSYLADPAGTVFETIGASLPPARHRAGTATQAVALAQAGLGRVLLTARAAQPHALRQEALACGIHHSVLLAVVAGRPVTKATDAFLKLARAQHWPPLPIGERVNP